MKYLGFLFQCIFLCLFTWGDVELYFLLTNSEIDRLRHHTIGLPLHCSTVHAGTELARQIRSWDEPRYSSEFLLAPYYFISADLLELFVNCLQQMEAEVNVFYKELPSAHKIDLLADQLRRLALQLDLLTEIDGQLLSQGRGSRQVLASAPASQKPEYPAEKMIPQLIKGRDRARPLKYDAKTQFYLHRWILAPSVGFTWINEYPFIWKEWLIQWQRKISPSINLHALHGSHKKLF